MSPPGGPPSPSHPLGHGRHAAKVGVRRVSPRWVAAVAVVVVIAVPAIVDAAGPPPSAPPPLPVGDGVMPATADAVSSSAFCSPAIASGEAAAITLTNSTASPVRGTATTVGSSAVGGTAPVVRQRVVVPASGSVTVNPTTGLPAGPVATRFAFAGGGVAATESVSGPNGWSSAPCATGTSTAWSFAGGATSSGNNVTLTLFNPTAVEAMVNVSFLTPSGLVAPQTYQGIAVPPGRVVVEHVGDYVPDASDIATFVEAQSSAVVSTELEESSGGAPGMSLLLGAPQTSTSWRFGQTTASSGTGVSFTLANPGQSAAAVTMTFGLATGTIQPKRIELGAQSLEEVAAGGQGGFPQGTPYAVAVDASSPIVVGRTVQAPTGSTPPRWGTSMATTSLSDHWLVPGPGSPGAPPVPGAAVDTIAVANPGGQSARVEIALVSGAGAPAAATVPPGRLAIVAVPGASGLGARTVRSSAQVVVESDSGPSGAPGVVSAAGIPLSG